MGQVIFPSSEVFLNRALVSLCPSCAGGPVELPAVDLGLELHLSLVSTISVSLMRASLSADGLSRLICLMASWQ